MDAVDVRGRFVWHQLLTRDVPGARKFYTKLIGWDAQSWPPDPSYTVFHLEGDPAAGMMAMTPEVPAEAPSHWLPYIGTRDVDGTADAAVRAGGSILKPPSDMKGAGRYAVLRDPQGAVFAIIDPEKVRPEPEVTPFGGFSWHELATSDHEAAFAFYSELFGWDAMERMDMGPSVGIYLMFGQNGVKKGGIYIMPPDKPAPPNWLPYAWVPNVDESVKVAEAAGGSIIYPPMDVPGGSRIAILTDSGGAAIALNSPPVVSTSVPSPEAAAQPKAAPKPVAKTKARKPKAKPKSKSKSKARPKTRPKTRTKSRAKAKSRPTRGKKSPKASPRKKTRTAARRKK